MLSDLLRAAQPKYFEDSERKPINRKLAQSLLHIVGHDAQKNLTEYVGRLARREMAAATLGAEAVALLADAHAHAAYLGRRLAGVPGAFGQADIDFGEAIAQEQGLFMSRFVNDIESGKYLLESGELDEKAIQRRADMYVKRLLGTANEAWAAAHPPDAQIAWRLGGTENHCPECPAYAEAGPYRADSLPAHPGDGSTTCGTNCLCYLENTDGEQGFPPIDFRSEPGE